MSKLIQSEKVPQNIIDSFRDFGTATISSALREVSGIRRAFMLGPVTFTPGKKTVGIATTLQFLPKREDIELLILLFYIWDFTGIIVKYYILKT